MSWVGSGLKLLAGADLGSERDINFLIMSARRFKKNKKCSHCSRGNVRLQPVNTEKIIFGYERRDGFQLNTVIWRRLGVNVQETQLPAL